MIAMIFTSIAGVLLAVGVVCVQFPWKGASQIDEPRSGRKHDSPPSHGEEGGRGC
jgi:hypothetical protein